MTSVNLSALPGISFAPQAASDVEAAIITTYETIAQVSLQPGDPVRLFLESLAYTLVVQNGLIDLAGKQNLLAYARGAHLDHLGALMGVARIPAQPARCLLRFAISEPLAFAVPVPEGTRVSTQSGKPMFAVVGNSAIEAGALYVDVVGFALSDGADANGLLPGQVTQLVDPLPYISSVSNVSMSLQGADTESDERLRERIRIAPESHTNAGSAGAYEAHALAVSQDIEAVSVTSPAPGLVDVRFVLAGGEMPDAAMIALVDDYLSGETVRPLTDTVYVSAPDPVEYALQGQWFLRRSDATLLSAVTVAVNAAVESWRVWQRGRPGRDINPSRLISLVEQVGAKRVTLTSPDFKVLTGTQIARETEINLVFGGVEDD